MITLLLLGPRPSGNLLSAAWDTQGPALTSATPCRSVGEERLDLTYPCVDFTFKFKRGSRLRLGPIWRGPGNRVPLPASKNKGLAERGQGCLDSVFSISRPWPWGSPVVKHSNLLSEQKLVKGLVAEVWMHRVVDTAP